MISLLLGPGALTTIFGASLAHWGIQSGNGKSSVVVLDFGFSSVCFVCFTGSGTDSFSVISLIPYPSRDLSRVKAPFGHAFMQAGSPAQRSHVNAVSTP